MIDLMTAAIAPLIASLYRAPHLQQGWQRFLEELVEMTGSQSGILSVENFETGVVHEFIQTGFDEISLKQWTDHFFTLDPWVNALSRVTIAPRNQFFVGDDLVDRKTLLSSEFFNDWGRTVNMHHATGAYVTDTNNEKMVRVACQQNHRQGRTSKQTVAILDSLIPDIRQAMTLAANHEQIVSKETSAVLEMISTPAVLTKKCGKILAANHLVATTFDGSNGISVRGDRFSFMSGNDGSRYAELLRGVLETDDPRRRSTTLRINDQKQVYLIAARPWLNDEDWFPLAEQPVLVTLQPLQAPTTIDGNTARAAFGFTMRETEVVLRISNGLTAKAIAQDMGIRESTVRSHIKSLLLKTSTNSQVQMISVLRTLSPIVG